MICSPSQVPLESVKGEGGCGEDHGDSLCLCVKGTHSAINTFVQVSGPFPFLNPPLPQPPVLCVWLDHIPSVGGGFTLYYSFGCFGGLTTQLPNKSYVESYSFL